VLVVDDAVDIVVVVDIAVVTVVIHHF
jgi:hypothetical protein